MQLQLSGTEYNLDVARGERNPFDELLLSLSEEKQDEKDERIRGEEMKQQEKMMQLFSSGKKRLKEETLRLEKVL